MIEFPASSLAAGDEFTLNDGQTWHKIKVCREARIVIITTEGHETTQAR